MKIVSFLNPKGGSGKTTAVVNVATSLVRKGFKVAVVDTDDQESVANWNENQTAIFDIFTAESEKDVYQVRKDLKHFDYVIIDGAGILDIVTSASVMVSDLIVIPVAPSPLDFRTSTALFPLIEAQAFNRPVEAFYLVTKKKPNTKMYRRLKDNIKESGFPQIRVEINQRESYIQPFDDGLTVYDTNDGAAKGEIDCLAAELISMLNK